MMQDSARVAIFLDRDGTVIRENGYLSSVRQLRLLPGAGAGAITYLAWTKPARIAVQPLVERGRPVPIPPELTPTEILDAAGLDDRGRKQA